MFKQRLIMTLLLIPLVLAAIYLAPWWLFTSLMFVLAVSMSLEWQQFLNLAQLSNPYTKAGLLFLGALLVFKYMGFFVYIDVLFWLAACIFVLAFPKFQNIWGRNGFIGMNAWILLGVFLAILQEWQSTDLGKNTIVCVFLLVWSADIGAYLVGRRWGQHKMIPMLSPGKSWEGLLGGMAMVLFMAAIEANFIQPFSLFRWFLLASLVGLISVIGDLWMSALKRHAGLKDTGHLIPGHGGILDRLDSLLAAVPVFYLVQQFLGPIA